MPTTCINVVTISATLALLAAPLAFAQERTRQRVPPSPAHHRPGEIGWNLAPEDEKYAAIDGDHLMEFVKDQTAISRRYRDNGHPQYWGRITGTEADAENAEWIGLRVLRDSACLKKSMQRTSDSPH